MRDWKNVLLPILLLLALSCGWTTEAQAQNEMMGITTTGDTIIVNPDGSWRVKGKSGSLRPASEQPKLLRPLRPRMGRDSAPGTPQPREATPVPNSFGDERRNPETQPPAKGFPVNPYPYEVPGEANYYKQDPQQRYRLWYQAEAWMPMDPKEMGSQADLILLHLPSNGEAVAMLTVVPQKVDLKALAQQTLADAQSVVPNASIAAQELRLVNERYLLCLRLDGSLQDQAFTYYSYYRSAENFTVQLTIYAPRQAFLRNQQAFQALLNGLVVP